ncbi:hypothetical protein LEL_07832 [Akanthomyces lecanii RCEF 1005]|uniref:DEUBAD domain-containing protein n=1 Tax=Akanthomyces lecanii RCEF 1005 TaxID=1081108 RepID=A0A168G066_CORDF|nr:hypothetical protein LEL_07832 [Akanthomyces lecanii RCEF 1005]
MAATEKELTPGEDEIEVATTNDAAHIEAPNAAPEASAQEADAANTGLASRPRRSLRGAGRAIEDSIVKKTVKIIAKRPQRKWDAERLLTDPKSPLAKANLRTILTNPLAWSSLDADDHAEILAHFPDQRHILTADDGAARPNMESLMNDDSFRYDCAAYTESLVQGRHDPEWLAQAWAAHERRKAGDFKDFLRAKFESDWEVTLPPEQEAEREKEEEKGETGADHQDVEEESSQETETKEVVVDTNGLEE